jgi:septal ring factor EnvC (AmiA/AmiB activator)
VKVETEKERTQLKIEEQKRELTLVAMERQGVELDLQRLSEENAWLARAVTELRAEAVAGRARVGEAEKLLAITLQTEASTGGKVATGDGGGAVSDVLLQTASREQAGRAGDLLATVNRMSHMSINSAVRADSLEAVIKSNDLQMRRLRLVLEIELAKKKADVEQKINDLNIVLERDLPRDRALLQADWQGEKTKLDLASPLQRVGDVAVTEKPVRPRKARAAAILTFLGLFGGVSLALGWEYLENNRAVITASRRPA